MEPLLTHVSPCKFPKPLERGNLEIHIAVQEGARGNTGIRAQPSMPMVGAIRVGTNLDDGQIRLTNVECVLHLSSGFNDLWRRGGGGGTTTK